MLESKFRKKWLCQAFGGKPADYVKVKASEKSYLVAVQACTKTHMGEKKKEKPCSHPSP